MLWFEVDEDIADNLFRRGLALFLEVPLALAALDHCLEVLLQFEVRRRVSAAP